MRHCLFLGDAHILPEDKDFQERLSSFLHSLGGTFDHIFILGDLFEFWFGFDGYPFQEEYGIVLDALRYVVSRGIKLVYFEGNHDFNMGPIFLGELRASVFTNWSGFEVDGSRWFVTHGDLVESQYLRYGVYRRLIRNRLTYRLIRMLGPRIVLRVAGKMGDLSRQVYHKPHAYNHERYLAYSHSLFSKGYDVVIMGHTHKADIVEQKVGERTCLYVNCGDLRKDETFVTYHPETGFTVRTGLSPME